MDATQARNTLANCKAQMQQANDAYTRMKQLHDQNALPEIKWTEAQSQLAQAQAQLHMAQKALAIAHSIIRVLGQDQRTVSVTSFISCASPPFHTAYAPKVAGRNSTSRTLTPSSIASMAKTSTASVPWRNRWWRRCRRTPA